MTQNSRSRQPGRRKDLGFLVPEFEDLLLESEKIGHVRYSSENPKELISKRKEGVKGQTMPPPSGEINPVARKLNMEEDFSSSRSPSEEEDFKKAASPVFDSDLVEKYITKKPKPTRSSDDSSLKQD